MPKLRPNPLNKQAIVSEVLMNKINEKLGRYKMFRSDLAKAVGMCRKTMYDRFDNLGNLSLCELLRIGSVLKFTDTDYTEIITGKENKL